MSDLSELLKSHWEKAFSYAQFRELMDALSKDEKSTGEPTPANVRYTALNHNRMLKWDKHFKLQQDVIQLLKTFSRSEKWLVINESWCGDSAHSIPVMNRFAEQAPNIELRIVLRDENPNLMDQFLSNGKRSIPKLIRIDSKNWTVISTWGSRPVELVELIKTFQEGEISAEERAKAIQIWYARNRGLAVEQELAAMISEEIQL